MLSFLGLSKRPAPAASRSRRRRIARFEQLEQRQLLAGVPFGAEADDTGEYLLGSVLVTPVFMESNGQIDSNLENWTTLLIQQAKDKIVEGLQWWEDSLAAVSAVHSLDFQFDFSFADNPVETPYEPIARISNDYSLWIDDFFDAAGVNTSGGISAAIRSFNHSQRLAHGTDWAFTLFVVNDDNDLDGSFAFGGSFSRAFAFAGGRFFITPAGRPASTIAHETGHIFYARDEYLGGGSYTDHRGYYNTQNINAADNPGHTQVDSIMASGALLQNAYDNHTSSPTSLAMLGWQDGDGDGVFDLLDVPLLLNGVGQYDADTGLYHFAGQSTAGTLPNLNSSGLQNDITINEVNVLEFSIDGGVWTAAESFDDYSVEFDVAVAAPSGFSEIAFRTRSVDPITGQAVAESNVFLGGAAGRSTTASPGINGVVFHDEDGDGQVDAGESGLSGWTVHVVDAQGQPLDVESTVEPDDYSQGQILNNVHPQVELSAVGSDVANSSVAAQIGQSASTGGKVFYNFSEVQSGPSAVWTAETRQLRMDFAAPVSRVSLDAIGVGISGRGRLEIYDAGGALLDRYTTDGLAAGQVDTMHFERPQNDIAYAIARGHTTGSALFDNLRFGPVGSTVTDATGAYSLGGLAAGDYTVEVAAPAGWDHTAPPGGAQSVSVAAGAIVQQIDFGLAATTGGAPWQNPDNQYDVDGDGFVAPNDVLLIINNINSLGSRQLPPVQPGGESAPPFIDVNGDGFVAPDDALMIINHINSLLHAPPPEAEGESEEGDQPEAEPPPIPQTAPSPAHVSARILGDDVGSYYHYASRIDAAPPARADLFFALNLDFDRALAPEQPMVAGDSVQIARANPRTRLDEANQPAQAENERETPSADRTRPWSPQWRLRERAELAIQLDALLGEIAPEIALEWQGGAPPQSSEQSSDTTAANAVSAPKEPS